MKLTNKQKRELDFFCKTYKINPSEQEIEQYFDWTINGKQKDINNIRTTNCLFQAKRMWDIALKQFKVDVREKITTKEELIEDFNHPYATKCLKKLLSL